MGLRIFRESDGTLVIHWRTGRTSCRNKVRHDTMQKATLAAYHMEEKRPGESFEPYACEVCGTYHIGHSRHIIAP